MYPTTKEVSREITFQPRARSQEPEGSLTPRVTSKLGSLTTKEVSSEMVFQPGARSQEPGGNLTSIVTARRAIVTAKRACISSSYSQLERFPN